MLKKIVQIIEIYDNAVEELHKIKPTARTALAMATISCYKRKNYSEAVSYCKEALPLFEKESDKIRTYYILLKAINSLDNILQRENAYNILRLNPKRSFCLCCYWRFILWFRFSLGL